MFSNRSQVWQDSGLDAGPLGQLALEGGKVVIVPWVQDRGEMRRSGIPSPDLLGSDTRPKNDLIRLDADSLVPDGEYSRLTVVGKPGEDLHIRMGRLRIGEGVEARLPRVPSRGDVSLRDNIHLPGCLGREFSQVASADRGQFRFFGPL